MAPLRDLEARVAASMGEWKRYLAEGGRPPAPLLRDAGEAEEAVSAALAEGGEAALFALSEVLLLADAVPLSLSADLAALAIAAARASSKTRASLATQAPLLWEAGGHGLEVLAALLAAAQGRAAVLAVWAHAHLGDLSAPRLRLLRRTLCACDDEELAPLACRLYSGASASWHGDSVLWNKLAASADGQRAFARAEELWWGMCAGKEDLSPGGTTCAPSTGAQEDPGSPEIPSTPSWPSSPALLAETPPVVYAEGTVFLLPAPVLGF